MLDGPISGNVLFDSNNKKFPCKKGNNLNKKAGDITGHKTLLSKDNLLSR